MKRVGFSFLAALCLPMVFLLFSGHAVSAVDGNPYYSYEALLDFDNDPSTGGNITVTQAGETPHDVEGIEFMVVIHFSAESAKLGPISTYQYNDQSDRFDLVNTNAGLYDIGFGNGINGSDVVEFEAPWDILGALRGQLRVVYHSSAGGFSDYTADFLFSKSAPREVEVAVPALGGPGGILLALLILVLCIWMVRRQKSLSGKMFVVLIPFTMATGLAWALAIALDGEVNDWKELTPAVVDPVGDSSLRDPYEDIIAGFMTSDTSKLYFRLDVVGKKGENPMIDVEKLINGSDADEPPGPNFVAGAPLLWTYVAGNTGNVPLSKVSVTDDQGITVTCPKSTLSPGEFMICTAQGTAALGQHANLGTATGTSPSGVDATGSDPCHYFGESPEQPDIALEKLVNGQDADEPPGPTISVGTPVGWSYIVTNTGDIALSGISVVDDQGVIVTCPKTTLAPGESMTCTGQGVAAAGQYVNLGTVSGSSPFGTPVTDADPCHYYGQSPPPGGEGCTPNYWKNHTGSWPPTGYSPTMTVMSVFPSASTYALGNYTLLEALNFGGGQSVSGAAEIVLRAGVAALLNAAHPNVQYPLTAAAVLSQVEAALASGIRDSMLILAATLDANNNLGCPLP